MSSAISAWMLAPGHMAAVLDHARRPDACADVSRAAQNVLLGEEPAQALDRLDAILERDHGGVLADDGLQALRSRLGVPQLHREQHHVDYARLARVLVNLHLELRVAVRALYGETLFLDCLEMPTAGEEHHVVPGLLQPRAEITSDASSSHRCNSHKESETKLGTDPRFPENVVCPGF